MLTARLTDITESNGQQIDRIITLKFPSYYISHSNKVLWLLHQHRQAYDLYDTEYSDLHSTQFGRAWFLKLSFRMSHCYPNISYPLQSLVGSLKDLCVTTKLRQTLSILHHPEYYNCEESEPFILVPGRLSKIKRQKLIIEAIKEVPFRMKLVFIGQDDETYGKDCQGFRSS